MTPKLRAGVARANITPPAGIVMVNWGAQTHTRAEDVAMELFATALIVSDGDEIAAIVDLDLCFLTEAQSNAIRAKAAEVSGIPFRNIRLSCSHTHSGPTIWPVWVKEGTELVPAYLEGLAGAVAGAVWEARLRLRPARIGGGVGHVAIGVNRRCQLDSGLTIAGRHWAGFVDHEVRVARIDDEAGRPIAAIVNYAAHPTIMAHQNTRITPDYPGPLRQTVERVLREALGADARCLFLQGAAGNCHPRATFSNRWEDCVRTGSLIGLEAARVLLEIDPIPRRERLVDVVHSGADLGIYVDEPTGEPDGTVRVATRRCTVPLKDLGDPATFDAEADRWRAAVQHLLADHADAEAIRQANFQAKRAAMRARLAHAIRQPGAGEIELHGIRIGGVAIVGVPGEPFMEIGVAIKQQSPFTHTIFGGYANGGGAYIPTAAEYARGGYEPDWGTPYAPGADAVIIQASLDLLADLARN